MTRREGTGLRPLWDIRRLDVLVLHPADRDCEELRAQVARIGCQVRTAWPPPESLDADVDIVFMLFRQESQIAPLMRAIGQRKSPPALIAIVEFENPTAIEAILKAGAVSAISKPIRAFGLLTAMVIAHKLHSTNESSAARISKLESRLKGVRIIEQAKALLMARKGITESEAYEMIRAHAMKERVSMEEICAVLVSANGMLGQ